MRWQDRLRVLLTGRLPEEVKQEVVAGAAVASPGVARWPEPGFLNWAKEAYGKNELVYACITEIAASVPEAPLRVYRETEAGLEEVPEHPLRQLIRRPNPVQSEYELWELTVVHLYLAGNAFWEIVRSRDGRPVELWPLRPDLVRIIPVQDPRIHHTYAYVVDGKLYDLGTDVVHFKLPNPVDPYFGQPPLRAAIRAVAIDNEASEYVKTLLQNDALPLTVIKVQKQLDEDTRERLEERWRNRHGRDRRGGVGIISGDADIKVLGLNLRDLEFPDLRAISETRICAAFGVPPILVGAKVGMDRSTYANYQEARRSFWEETVSPLLRRLQDRINHKLLPMFGNVRGLEARFDKSDVTALQESVDKLWARVTRAVEAGWILLDEARVEAGFDPLPDGRGRVRLRRTGVEEIPVDGDGEGESGPQPGVSPPQPGESPPPAPTPPPEGGSGSGGQTEDPAQPAAGSAQGQPTGQEPEARQRGPTRLLKAREEIARSRQRLADRYEARWREWAAEEFRMQARDTLRAFFAGKGLRSKQLGDEELLRMLTQLYQLGSAWDQRIRESVHDLALEHLTEAANEAGAELDVAFELPNEYAQRFVQQYTFPFANALADTSVERIREIILAGQRDGLTIAEMRNQLLEEFDDWTKSRAEMVARTESIRASNAGAVMAYQQAGVEMVEWLPASDACPYCAALKGKRWATGGELFKLGDEWQPQGAERPFRVSYEPVRHPPLHPNCRCTLVPVIE